ncbi:YesL family protein [Halalkalibacter kiskunsagensis]|uniref:YesL family protein n=1 Tax=Halalkalibacter kiskunsagensis TaxID=1548599 RepID=A0ABV6KIG3_9BACI
MNLFQSRFILVLEKLTSFFLLNILWLIMCIPIITIFPATAAMFAVVRQWIRKEDSSNVFKPFFLYFKENFKQSFVIGVIWVILSYLIILNIRMLPTIESTALKSMMFPLLLIFCIFFVLTSLFLFPVLVHYKLPLTGVLRNAFLLSVSKLQVSLLCVLFVGAAMLLFFFYPLTILISFSLVSYFIYRICHKSFTDVDQKI